MNFSEVCHSCVSLTDNVMKLWQYITKKHQEGSARHLCMENNLLTLAYVLNRINVWTIGNSSLNMNEKT